MKQKLKLYMIALSFTALAAPLTAQARNCELPHEQLQMKCGGESANTYDAEDEADARSVSAVQKARPIGDVMKEYHERVNAYGAVVQKATDDYRAYLASKSR